MEIKEAITDEDILSCWPAMLVLRPHIKHEQFLTQLRTQQEEGLHFMYIQDPEDNKVKSILAFRTHNFLFCGKTLYVDTFATLEEGRGKGFGGALLDWVKKYAKENGYNTLSLDSGYTQKDAHRLYLSKGLTLNCHHFDMHIQD